MNQPLDLSPVIAPDAPTWWPLAWGWWALIITAIALIALVFFIVKRRQNNQHAKNEALARFRHGQSSDSLSPRTAQDIVRQAALSYFPREKIAGLAGDDWLKFLDAQLEKPLFVAKQSQWQQALYQDAALMNDEQKMDQQQLVNDCETWLCKALPPKRGRYE
ncbi:MULTISPECIES: DUF4381 domain-containing protein [Vibrio]|uniref:DUF4381 domain-containing protein n=1 Tax=Vibrio TaxID=662 RepID=UPI0002E3C677|nr:MULTISPECIES: DUF4381 domain-containing protein [Vibrio]ERM58184.1 hypothetical protein M565_ctg5P1155 [Vibrio cyclitrophicus FF75]MDH5878184.1 DUF4381 domain-containing protein [Vibrio sp. S/42/10]OCH46777.1 hypothetical protein A6D96_19135 [Vibrio cyclitrophicus]OEE45864.1 hypothetical protein OAG_15055 [Vibrio cyclitrophicus FF75]PMF31958.1 hypothetical protein BCV17_06955 [Vibrio cyclitrophicus]